MEMPANITGLFSTTPRQVRIQRGTASGHNKEFTVRLGVAELQVQAHDTNMRLVLTLGHDKLEMQLSYPRLRVISQSRRMRLPAGATGHIALNSKPLAQFRHSTATLSSAPELSLRVQEDTAARRYLWARAHGLNLWQALRYSGARSAIVLAPQAAFAGFGGDPAHSPLLPPTDAAVAATLPPELQYTLLALSLAWCAMALGMDGFIISEDTPLYGGPVADLPSFTPTADGEPCITPPPAARGEHGVVRLVSFGLWNALICVVCLFFAALCLRSFTLNGLLYSLPWLTGAAVIILLNRNNPQT